MTRRTRVRWMAAALAFGILAAACGGNAGGGEAAADIVKQRGRDIKPPDPVDPKATALPGLVVNTNSPTWRKLISAPEADGAVVLYVQPEGPSDRKRIARGHVLTAVDGTAVGNHEQAIALLRSRPGQKRELTFVTNEGEERTVEIEAKVPNVTSVRPFVDVQIEGNPNDPLFRFIRAQSSGGTFDANLADVTKALELEPDFVEAMTLRASLLWDRRLVDRDNALRLANDALAGWKGALDIDPENVTTLSVRSSALTALGRGRQAQRDAEEALSIDDAHPHSYYSLALAMARLDEDERALAAARAAVELNPYNVVYFRGLARSFSRLGREDDCTKTAEAMGPFLEAQGLAKDAEALTNICE